MSKNHQNETESRQIADEKTLLLTPLSPKGPEKLDSLHDNRLEDTIKDLRDRGYNVTEEYSGDTPEKVSKVRLERPPRPPRKTWWDWLQLLIVPLLILGVGSWFTWEQNQTNLQIAQANRQKDIQLASDQQQETILKTYLDDMSGLLLNQKPDLRTSDPGAEIRQVARERTLTTLRRLDPRRNSFVLQFLRGAGLIGIQNAVINLSNADLSSDDLSGANLSGVDLSRDNFNDSHLYGTDLYGSNLIGATLGHADLSRADLSEALLSHVSLNSAHLNSARLSNADLRGADLSNATLSEALLSDTILNGAHLDHADLSRATLNGAHLSDADLSNTNLNGVSNLTQQQLDAVSSCTKANPLPAGLRCPHSGSMVTLTYWYTESTAETPVILQLIQQFEQEYPNIKINPVYKPFLQTQAAFITATQVGNAPGQSHLNNPIHRNKETRR